MVFGNTLCLPGELITFPKDQTLPDPSDFVDIKTTYGEASTSINETICSQE